VSGAETAPGPWISRRQYSDLAHQFAQALTDAEGEVRQADSLKGALEQLGRLIDEIGARRVLADWQYPIMKIDLNSRWPDVSWHLVSQSEGDLRDFAISADMGLSVGQVALAETGSVLISSGSGQSRLTSLLPPVHVVLVATSCLTADIFTWTAGRHDKLPASLTLISGPSKTADIEQTMAIGVHGPGRFIAILYDDESL
jgi:L-lactate dehydrogenase complex protein LldG